jgi:hypothetical protein
MNILRSAVLLIFSFILLSGSCKKNVITPQEELSKLPPATQTGANTFGCLVNGHALVPGGSLFSGAHTQCNYIFTAGGYHLTIEGDADNNSQIKQILIETDSLAVTQGQSLTFKAYASGNADAFYDLITSTGSQNKYRTTNTISGQLTITKLDPIKQIVSGTFYFKAINISGDTVKVTDGRFDMLYTR